MNIGWSAVEGALIVGGSRGTAVNTLWRLVPEDERTPARRKLVIAITDFVRDYHERTGHLAPPAEDAQ